MKAATAFFCGAFLAVGAAAALAGDGVQSSERGVGALFPDLAFSDAAGAAHNIADYRGKVLFLNFWAEWCGPCKAEIPSISSLQAKFSGRDDIQFILVSMNKNFAKDVDYAQRKRLAIPVMRLRDGLSDQARYHIFNVSESYQSWRIPQTLILDRDGRVAYVASYSKDWREEEGRLAALAADR